MFGMREIASTCWKGVVKYDILYITENIKPRYTQVDHLIGKTISGDRDKGEIVADMTSSFFVLLAIYFPSVTGKV